MIIRKLELNAGVVFIKNIITNMNYMYIFMKLLFHLRPSFHSSAHQHCDDHYKNEQCWGDGHIKHYCRYFPGHFCKKREMKI